MFQQKVSLLHLPLFLVAGGLLAWLSMGIYLLMTPVTTTISQNIPTATASNAEAEFISNQLLVKVKKTAKNKVKTDNPKATGLSALDIPTQKNAVKKIEKIAKENNKSKKDSPLFQWFLVTFDEPEEKIKGSWDPELKQLKTDHVDKTKWETRLQLVAADPDIEAVELNYVAYATQEDTELPTAPSNLRASNITSTGVTLSWDPATDNVGIGVYNIYRDGVMVRQGNVLTTTLSNLTPITTYTYIVRAQDSSGNIGQPSNAVTITTLSEFPPPTLTPTPTPIGTGSTAPYFTPTPTSIGIGTTTPASPTLTPLPANVPNDPYYASSGAWGQTYPDMWGMKRINAEGAWHETTGSSSIVVAVIDSGIDRNHEDLANNIWSNPNEIADNGVDDDSNGYVDDKYGWNFISNNNNPTDDRGHGTEVAGVIAASGNNNVGVVGVNWNTKVVGVKIFGPTGTTPWSTIIAGMQYAADLNVDVMNSSLGSQYSYRYEPLEDILSYIHSKNIVHAVAAGNNNGNALDFIPASSPYVIAVGATDQNDQRSDWGGGSGSNYGEKIDITAPGSNILMPLSAVNSGCPIVVGSKYCVSNGTSFASPHVAGLAALLLAKNSALTNEEVRQILRRSVTDLGTAGRDSNFGYGLINAGIATSKADQNPLTLFINSPQSKTSISGTIAITGSANGPNFGAYIVEMGLGRSPSTWHILNTSAAPASNNTLATFNTSDYPSGIYTIRLTALDRNSVPYYFEMYDITLQPTIPTATPTPTMNPISTPTPTTAIPTFTPTSTPTTTPTKTPTPIPPTNTPTVTPTRTPTPTSADLAPTVSITNPKNGAQVRRNSKVILAATATDDRGVTKVEFYINNVLWCVDTTSIYNCTWRVPNTRNTNYTIQARAYDTTGKTTNTSIIVTAQ